MRSTGSTLVEEDVMDKQLSVYFPGRECVSDEGWPEERVVMATPEEIRYARQLLLQIRSAYHHEAASLPRSWSMGGERVCRRA
jgi:hypothetical protein